MRMRMHENEYESEENEEYQFTLDIDDEEYAQMRMSEDEIEGIRPAAQPEEEEELAHVMAYSERSQNTETERRRRAIILKNLPFVDLETKRKYLYKAVRTGDLQIVKLLLDKPDPNVLVTWPSKRPPKPAATNQADSENAQHNVDEQQQPPTPQEQQEQQQTGPEPAFRSTLPDNSSMIEMKWFGENLLVAAIKNDQEQVGMYLVRKGIDTDSLIRGAEVPADSNEPHSFTVSCRQLAYVKKMFNLVSRIDEVQEKLKRARELEEMRLYWKSAVPVLLLDPFSKVQATSFASRRPHRSTKTYSNQEQEQFTSELRRATTVLPDVFPSRSNSQMSNRSPSPAASVSSMPIYIPGLRLRSYSRMTEIAVAASTHYTVRPVSRSRSNASLMKQCISDRSDVQ